LERRSFLQQIGFLSITAIPGLSDLLMSSYKNMKTNQVYDAIVIGGSYAGLASAMAMGRALKRVLVIDSGKPSNAQTPHSHNFLTQDGSTPAAIASQGKQQVLQYDTVSFFNGTAVNGRKTNNGFEIQTATGDIFLARKLIFATGIKDLMPNIKGFEECWGKSVIHCPYCHGYEVRNLRTGIFGDGKPIYEFALLISNWTKDLTIYTNGPSTFDSIQLKTLHEHHIPVVEKEFQKLEHTDGYIQDILFRDGTKSKVTALYAPRPFKQHCNIPEALGCEITQEGYIQVDAFQETTIPGVYASGDNAGKMRTVANAVATGTTAGIAASKKLILEQF